MLPSANFAYVGSRNDYGIKGLPLDGGVAQSFNNDAIFRLQVCGSSVYWVNGTSLKRQDVTTLGNPDIVVIDGNGPLGSGLDAFFIRKQTIAYVKRRATGHSVFSCTLPGCVPADGGAPPTASFPILAMAMDDTSIYWAEPHSVRKCDLKACSAMSQVTLFADPVGLIADIAVDATTTCVADPGANDAGAGIYAVAK